MLFEGTQALCARLVGARADEDFAFGGVAARTGDGVGVGDGGVAVGDVTQVAQGGVGLGEGATRRQVDVELAEAGIGARHEAGRQELPGGGEDEDGGAQGSFAMAQCPF